MAIIETDEAANNLRAPHAVPVDDENSGAYPSSSVYIYQPAPAGTNISNRHYDYWHVLVIVHIIGSARGFSFHVPELLLPTATNLLPRLLPS